MLRIDKSEGWNRELPETIRMYQKLIILMKFRTFKGIEAFV